MLVMCLMLCLGEHIVWVIYHGGVCLAGIVISADGQPSSENRARGPQNRNPCVESAYTAIYDPPKSISS